MLQCLRKKDMDNMGFRWVYFNKLIYTLDQATVAVVSHLRADPLGSNVLCWGGPVLPQGDTAQFTACSIQYVNTQAGRHAL